jgi:uncharacterized protein DUF2510
VIRGLALSASGLGLFGSMFLPWYSVEQSEFQRRAAEALRQFGAKSSTDTNLDAVQALDFIALALFTMGLIALVLGLAIAFGPRGEGESGAIGVLGATGTAAGLVAGGMIAYRIVIPPDSDYSVDYGIFVALGTASVMIFAGLAGARSRAVAAAQPPRGVPATEAGGSHARVAAEPARRRPPAGAVSNKPGDRPQRTVAGKVLASGLSQRKNPPSPGWYRDRRGEARLRWWDGERWTEETSD